MGIRKRKAHPTGVVLRNVRARNDSTSIPQQESKAPESPGMKELRKWMLEMKMLKWNLWEFEIQHHHQHQKNPTINISPDHQKTPEQQTKKVEDPSSTKKAITSSSSHGFPKASSEYLEDLPSGNFGVFNDGKINVLTKKVSVLEIAKSKAEAEREESKEKLEALKAENVILRKEIGSAIGSMV
ncbi:hypothetical protein Hanom_Chr15g01407061 [Helianthus anomalus]